MRIQTWKKIITIVGLLTLEVGHLTRNPIIILLGLTSSIAGVILMFIYK